MGTIIINPIEIDIEKELRKQLQDLCKEESQVIVHCRVVEDFIHNIRIWKSTNLIAHGSGEKSALTHAENITFHPQWTHCFNGQHNFTLFFKGLPKDCNVFDLFEEIPEPGGFSKKNIKRNKSDVYHIRL
ncbi:hypothetical protein N9Y36_04870 [Ulvibacter sp.]|nr:hypothetical protein [Ulvibacter sp.]